MPTDTNEYMPTRMRRSLSTSTIDQYLTTSPELKIDTVANRSASSMFDDVVMPSKISEPSITSYLASGGGRIATPLVS